MIRFGGVIATTMLCMATGVLLWHALRFAPVARVAPISMVAPTLGVLLVQLLLDIRAMIRRQEDSDGDGGGRPIRRELVVFAIVCIVALGVDILGLATGAALCLLGLLSFWARVAMLRAALISAVAFFAIRIGFDRFLGLLLPRGRLWDWLGM